MSKFDYQTAASFALALLVSTVSTAMLFAATSVPAVTTIAG